MLEVFFEITKKRLAPQLVDRVFYNLMMYIFLIMKSIVVCEWNIFIARFMSERVII
jgi:hypothetical protein